jgi:hypothetical protein
MKISASSVIGKVRHILFDALVTIGDTSDGVAWTNEELLNWISDGQVAISASNPGSCTEYSIYKLSPGAIQTIPDKAYALLDVTRNMGIAGTAPGATVQKIPRASLDNLYPDWHRSSPASVVKGFCYSSDSPEKFFCYPPQPKTNQGYVEVLVATTPTPVSVATQSLSISERYEPALVDYVAYRAFSRNSDNAQYLNLAESFRVRYASATGDSLKMDAAIEGQGGQQPAQPQAKGQQ